MSSGGEKWGILNKGARKENFEGGIDWEIKIWELFLGFWARGPQFLDSKGF